MTYQILSQESGAPITEIPPLSRVASSSSDLDLPIALRKGKRSCTNHPISHFLSYRALTFKQPFLQPENLPVLPKHCLTRSGRKLWKRKWKPCREMGLGNPIAMETESLKRRKMMETPTPITELRMSIPLDIIIDILSRLPVKILSRFKCVSKSWYNLLTRDSSFINKHLDRSIRDKKYYFLFSSPPRFYSIPYLSSGPQIQHPSPQPLNSPFPLDDNKVRPVIVGDSCRGVFLIGDSRARSVLFLWNPATQEHKRLPDSLIQFPGNSYYCGLGYDDSTGDFKVVIIYCRYMYNLDSRVPYYESGWEVCIYSLRSNTVKRIQCNPYLVHNNLSHDHITHVTLEIFREKQDVNGGIFAKGAIHWLLKASILTFNVSTEEYKQLPLPDFIMKIGHPLHQKYSIGELKDCICLTVRDGADLSIHVFVTQDCTMWTNLFTLHPDRYFGEVIGLAWFISIYKSIIFEWFTFFSEDTERLAVYEAEERSTKYLDMRDFPYAIPEPFNGFMFYRAYVQSLVSLEPIIFVEEN